MSIFVKPKIKGAHIAGASTKRLQRLFAVWARQKALDNKLAFGLVLLAIIFGIMTYMALTASGPFANDPNAIIWLLNIDLIIILLFLMLIARRISALWMSRRRGVAGARLHVRLVVIFSLLAGVPAIVMTLFSAFFFYYSIHGWFSQNVERAVNESLAVAEAYLSEHQQTIKADTFAMAKDLDRQSTLLTGSEKAMNQMMQTQSFFRNLSEAVLLNREGEILAQSDFSLTLGFTKIPDELFDEADKGELVLIQNRESEDRVRALLKLEKYFDTYLYVGRLIDQKVLSHLAATRKGVQEYQALQGSSTKIQITITIIYVVLAILLMVSAIWFGLNVARRIVEPIGKLISTAELVGTGDLSARASGIRTKDEFETLAQSFNQMTEQLQIQQNELVDANKKLDYRRRFTETILGGVSTGVISIDSSHNITLLNISAYNLLGGVDDGDGNLVGKHIASVLPESFKLIEEAFLAPEKPHQQDIEYRRSDGVKRSFKLNVSIELIGENETGAIVTFDDITDILNAQRRTAWSDVARRIAHEIKNPLTPIQLSTERLRRKYLKTLEEEKDRAIFEQSTQTIIKHVDDIKNMVNAFSDFAKMPDPVFKPVAITSLVKEIYALQSEANAQIGFSLYNAADTALNIQCDEQQIRQSITNLIQNAVEAFEESETPIDKPQISVCMQAGEKSLHIGVCDNGMGISADLIDRITEPYVTHKKKGTGLGLAIVKKIVEDHNGHLIFNPENLSEHVDFSLVEGMNEQDFKELFSGVKVFLTLPLHNAA